MVLTTTKRGSRYGRRQRRPWWLMIVLSAVLITAYSLNPAPARADGTVIGTWCFNSSGQVVPCTSGGPLPPAPLLNTGELDGNLNGAVYSATMAEETSLQNLEQAAVANVAQNYRLAPGDADAVQSWSRDDAEAELFALIVQAINTSACSSSQTPGQGCRTTDQQNAVDWVSDVAKAEIVGPQSGPAFYSGPAYYTGLEYTKWAGLSQSSYNSLVDTYNTDLIFNRDTTQDKTNLENFLNTTPQSYAAPTAGTSWTSDTSLTTIQNTATEGYCVYQPPAPFQSDYTGNIFTPLGQSTMPAICEVPGGGIGCLIDCNPDTPAYEDFVKWGQADAQYAITNNQQFTETAHDISLAIGVGGVTAAVGAGVGLFGALSATMAGTAFQTALFPFAAAPIAVGNVAAGGGLISTSADVATAAAGAVGAAGVAAIVGAVLLFIAGTTVEVINLVHDTQLPGKVASLIEDAPTQNVDPTSMTGNSNGAGGLFSLFVNATLPSPNTNCNDGSLVSGGSDCLDPPAPPTPDVQHDPEFLVSENGGAASPQNSIAWYDKAGKMTNTARLHETWFVERSTDSNGNTLQVMDNDGVTRPDIQTLRIAYTDWTGAEQVATLANVPNVGYRFVSIVQGDPSGTTLDPSTCVADNTCTYASSIHYVDSSGNQYSASVVPSQVPAINSTRATGDGNCTNDFEGCPVTFSADATSPISAPLTYTWTIQDKPVNPPFCSQPPCPAPVVRTGNPMTYTFPTSGSFTVDLTVTDPTGRFATSQSTIDAFDVPPKLSLDPACSGTSGTPCNTTAVPSGSQTTLSGAIVHAGSEDVERLDVNWGDGSPDDTYSNQGLQTDQNVSYGNPSTTSDSVYPPYNPYGGISLPFTATHSYASPGSYTATVTVTDQSGATDTKTLSETVLFPTQTSLTSSPNPSTYGQSVTFTATVTNTGGGTPTGEVTFYNNAFDVRSELGTGNLSTSNGVTTATLTRSDLIASVFTFYDIIAVYGGDSTFDSSTSSSLSQTINPADTSTTITANHNPAVWGQPVTFTATVSVKSPGGGTPTGTVTFSDGTSSLGTGSLSTSNNVTTATLTTSTLAVSTGSVTHAITASYGGDQFGDYNTSTSSPLTETVNKAGTSTTINTSGSPSTQGGNVTFTANVSATAPGAGTPTGTVTFKDGSTTLGTGPVSSGQATFSTSSLGAGAHSVTATYGGDGNFLSSGSPTITQYINTSLTSYPKLPSGAYNLSNINLTGGAFVGDSLIGASLTNSNLTGTLFIGANLTGANLSNGNFTGGVNFSNANLTSANLSTGNFKGAIFTGANLTGANLTRASFKGATGLSSATLTGVIWNSTTCPDGTISNRDGGTCAGHL